jgi:hypothetical protein
LCLRVEDWFDENCYWPGRGAWAEDELLLFYCMF